MTSAERAKEIVVSIIGNMLADGAVTAGSGERWVALITQAITQAQNDKLEEAALFLEEMPPSNEVEDLGTAAILIRELKSKD